MRKHFTLRNDPIGDTYHLAAAAYLLQQIGEVVSVDFPSSPRSEEFFHFLGIHTPRPDPADEQQSLPDTAKIIKRYFSPGCLDALKAKIQEAARPQPWEFPYPELATEGPKLLIWQRQRHDWKNHRNSTLALLKDLVQLCGDRTVS